MNGDDVKWLECICEVEDAEFVTVNIEHRIGKNVLNKGMWKLYIEYLRNTKPRVSILAVLFSLLKHASILGDVGSVLKICSILFG